MNTPLSQHLPTNSPTNNSRLMLWLSKLPKHVLALDSDVVDNIISELNNPNVDSEKLAFHIRQDPILCLKLYLKGARQLKERQGNIQGLIHLLGLLGQEKIKTVIDDAPKVCNISNGQRELLSASLFSAHLASQLLPEKHGTKGERFFLPTLLFNSPIWLMWTAAPKLMQQGQHLASQKKQPLDALCKKTLGFSLDELLSQTQVFLPLPDLSLKALALNVKNNARLWATIQRLPMEQLPGFFEKNTAAKRLFCDAGTGIYLINQYVLALYLDWHGKHIKRWTLLLCRHLMIETDELAQSVADIASTITLPAYLGGSFAPLYRFRGLHKELPSSSANDTIAIIKHYLQQLRSTSNRNQCLQLSMEALTKGAEVEHCMMLTINNNRLQIPLAHGFGDNKVNSININFKDCGQVFKALLQKPMTLSIDTDNLARISKQLPAALTQLWQPRPCGLMSLFHEGKPYAIVICDHKEWHDQRHQQFKVIGKQLSQSLKQCKNV